MKSIKNFQNSEIENLSMSAITGGNDTCKTGKNADGLYTDVWEDSNGDDKFGEGDLFCIREPFE